VAVSNASAYETKDVKKWKRVRQGGKELEGYSFLIRLSFEVVVDMEQGSSSSSSSSSPHLQIVLPGGSLSNLKQEAFSNNISRHNDNSRDMNGR
jgi:hypothetical protein